MMTNKQIRAACQPRRKSIQIGRSSNSAGVVNAPILFVDGVKPPTLEGLPYLKTGFRNGPRFHKILYTPSTLRIEVGKEWVG